MPQGYSGFAVDSKKLGRKLANSSQVLQVPS